MDIKIKTPSAKSICIVLALSFVAFLGAVLVLRETPSGEKRRPEAIKTEEVEKEPLPQKEPVAHPFKLNSRGTIKKSIEDPSPYPETDLKTMQGEVTIIDWCLGTVYIDDVPLEAGSLNLVGIVEVGDFVELTYRERNRERVMQSIKVLR